MEKVVTPRVVQSLSESVRAADGVIERICYVISEKQREMAEYSEPARRLLGMVRNTRIELKRRAENAIKIIENETEILHQIQIQNDDSVADLRRTLARLGQTSHKDADSPMLMVVRAMSALMPFAIFTILTFCV
jgi:hypothetical protein